MADTAETVEAAGKLENAAGKAKDEMMVALDGVTKGDLSGLWPLLDDYVVPTASALLLIFIAYFVSKFIARICSLPIRTRIDETLGRFIGKLIFNSLMLFTLLGVLGMFGISVASFAAVIAAAGFAVGMAFQGTLSNFSAGILLLVFRPFKVGDVVSAGGVTGMVDEIDLFTTTFNTPDNRRMIVPNSAISGGTIENMSYHTHRRVDVFVGVEYSADLKETRAALGSAAESLRSKLVDGEGLGYQIYLLELGESSVKWVVRFWTNTGDFWVVKEDLTAAVKSELDRAEIGIPFPQLDVHLDGLSLGQQALKAVGN
ncbi:MAG: mechanosensitive ion channel [Bdellovibrionales bacterium]|nr:mechanosensitive ion channel [Bdellovibrionales bacterium]